MKTAGERTVETWQGSRGAILLCILLKTLLQMIRFDFKNDLSGSLGWRRRVYHHYLHQVFVHFICFALCLSTVRQICSWVSSYFGVRLFWYVVWVALKLGKALIYSVYWWLCPFFNFTSLVVSAPGVFPLYPSTLKGGKCPGIGWQFEHIAFLS